MRPSSATSRSVRVALRAAALLAVLVGIFGMHGLASHGVDNMDALPSAVLSATDSMTASPAVPVTSAMTSTERMQVSGSATMRDQAAATGGQRHDGGMSMAGMCLAILIVGLAAIYLWLTRQPLRRYAWVMPRLLAVPIAVSRDRDPPSLVALSIQRC